MKDNKEFTDEYLDYEENVTYAQEHIDKDVERLKGGDTAFAKHIIAQDYYIVPTANMGDLYFDFRLHKDIGSYDYMNELILAVQSAKYNVNEMIQFKDKVYKSKGEKK